MEMLLKCGETWLDLTFPATRTLLIRNYSVVLLDLKWNTVIYMAALKWIPSFTTRAHTHTHTHTQDGNGKFPNCGVFFAGSLQNLRRIIRGSPHYGLVFAPSTLTKTISTVL
jgi:hypothetical protein